MITFTYFDESYFDTLISWSGDETFMLQWAGPGFQYPLDRPQLEQYLRDSQDPLTSNSLIYMAVNDCTGIAVGHLTISMINRKHRTARIGYVLVEPSQRGQGIGEKIMTEAARISFEELKLHRIGLSVFDYNTSAIRCYEKVGFVREGILRDILFANGQYWNAIQMSMLEDEWFQRQRLF